MRARGKSGSKTDSKTDRQTDGLSKTTFLDVLGVVHYIPNPVLSRSRFFARCQYFHWHGSNISQVRYRKFSNNETLQVQYRYAIQRYWYSETPLVVREMLVNYRGREERIGGQLRDNSRGNVASGVSTRRYSSLLDRSLISVGLQAVTSYCILSALFNAAIEWLKYNTHYTKHSSEWVRGDRSMQPDADW